MARAHLNNVHIKSYKFFISKIIRFYKARHDRQELSEKAIKFYFIRSFMKIMKRLQVSGHLNQVNGQQEVNGQQAITHDTIIKLV